MCERRIYVGTAAWTIPKAYQDAFPNEGSHLVRYASRLDGVEINSSFYRPHRLSTYQRWADDVPDHFRFAVKMPKTIIHEGRLRDVDEPLQRFLGEIAGLGGKLGPVLIQLPPSLKFDPDAAEAFFRTLRDSFGGDIVCEPRHATWFTADVDAFLVEWKVARVAADPQPHPDARQPGGWRGLAYYRLHGSPKMYYSSYSDAELTEVVGELKELEAQGTRTWCIFDNTAEFAATANALATTYSFDDERVPPAGPAMPCTPGQSRGPFTASPRSSRVQPARSSAAGPRCHLVRTAAGYPRRSA